MNGIVTVIPVDSGKCFRLHSVIKSMQSLLNMEVKG